MTQLKLYHKKSSFSPFTLENVYTLRTHLSLCDQNTNVTIHANFLINLSLEIFTRFASMRCAHTHSFVKLALHILVLCRFTLFKIQ